LKLSVTFICREKDLDEVLQSTTIFNNVSKASIAKDKDMIAAFGTTNHEQICRIILEKGEFQVGASRRRR
jgi:ribosome maturation protein SDO1